MDVELLDQIINNIERGNSPNKKWPDLNGDYWGICPFHTDKSPGSFSFSPRGFKWFSCGESGGLEKLPSKLSIDTTKLDQGISTQRIRDVIKDKGSKENTLNIKICTLLDVLGRFEKRSCVDYTKTLRLVDQARIPRR